MRFKSGGRLLVAVIVAVGLAASGSTAASANQVDSDSSVESDFVSVLNLNGELETLEVPSDFNTVDALIADEDGGFRELLESDSGDADFEVGALRACSYTGAVATVGGYTNSPPGCSIIGHHGFINSSAWHRDGSATGNLCVQFRGYNSLGSSVWHGAGCGTSGSVNYHWGNTASVVQARGMSLEWHNVAYRFI